jgi:Flp pilus assembly pilin Flp
MRNLILKGMAWTEARRDIKWSEVVHKDEEGQTVIEYALVVAAVSIALILVLLTFGQSAVSRASSKVAAMVI